jgi:coenzyme Q-binding protein COQ10
LPQHSENRFVPYTSEQMFDLVADVERYPNFLPWCVATRIKSREGDNFTADLIAAFGAFREQFTSRVHLDRPAMTITVEYLDGPFEHLMNRWHFEGVDGGSMVHFDIDFAFKSKMLEKLISGVFTRAVVKMASSFDERAHALYGNKTSSGELPA